MYSRVPSPHSIYPGIRFRTGERDQPEITSILEKCMDPRKDLELNIN
jgi:hypothetical protein